MAPGRIQGQHHPRLAIVTAAGLAVALVAGVLGVSLPRGETLWHMVAGPQVDGSWRFVRINGVDVRRSGYTLGIMWGEVEGYSDGCNSCGMIESDGPYYTRQCTLMACAEDPNAHLVRRFLRRDPGTMELRQGRLYITRGQYRAELVRAGE